MRIRSYLRPRPLPAMKYACAFLTLIAVLLMPSSGAFNHRAASGDVDLRCGGNGTGVANPSAVYCGDLGYEYRDVSTAEGQQGICIFPNGDQCDAWQFLEGKCEDSYSYCAKQGYDSTTKTDGKNAFSPEYSVCVHDGQEIGAATELMGLSEKTINGNYPAPQRPNLPQEGFSPVGLPSSFDWRNHNGQNWMTSVKDQAYCGGCWAFASVGTTEAMYNIATNNPNLDLDLAEEYLISGCGAAAGIGSCLGGDPEAALRFIRDQGDPDEACLPWASAFCGVDSDTGACYTVPGGYCAYQGGSSCSNGTCSNRCADWQSRLTRIDAVGAVSPSEMKLDIVNNGPLVVGMGILKAFGGDWDGDVYRCADDTGENHEVIIVGYNDSGGYWIVKNSWGTSWPNGSLNDGGYFKVGYGECNIEQQVDRVDVLSQSHWYFAEGMTGDGWLTFISMMNPGDTPANVTATFNLEGGSPVVKSSVVPAHGRHTIWAHDPLYGPGPGWAFGVTLESDQPIVAQEALIQPAQHMAEGTIGTRQLAYSWDFAEGMTGDGWLTFISMSNPGDTPANVVATFNLEGAGPVVKNSVVPAHGRHTIWAHDPLYGPGPGWAFGVILQSDQPIVAQEALIQPVQQMAEGTIGFAGP